MGRHDAARSWRGPSTARLGSGLSSPGGDVEALRSPTASGGTEPRLLRQVLWVAVALTAGVFLLLVLSGSGSGWAQKTPNNTEVVVTEEPSGGISQGSLPDNKPTNGSSKVPTPTTATDLEGSLKDSDSGSAAFVAPKEVSLPADWQWDAYHNYSSSEAFLEWLQHNFSHLVTISVIGKSSEGLSIRALEITSPRKSSKKYKPMFKWLGGMHGDEMPSVELLIRFIYYLVSEYGKQERVTNLLQSVRVQLLPCLNEDGRQAHSRTNHHLKDLNRNFPVDTFNYRPSLAPDANSVALQDWREAGYGPPEPETNVAMSWYKNNSPTFLSANVHGGALVANYPLDACDDLARDAPCPTEEGDLPVYLAQVYSFNHPKMHLNTRENFKNGTINGAVWYPVVGSLQDWVYHATKGMHLTMELHQRHTEPAALLPKMWDDNVASLMRFTEMVHLGLLLWVVDNSTNTFLHASVKVLSPANIRAPNAFTDHNSQPAYFKLMSPGVEYCLEVQPLEAAGGSRKHLLGKEYPKVLVGAKLSAAPEEVIKGKSLSGLRIEYALRVDAGTNKRMVAVGGAKSTACKSV